MPERRRPPVYGSGAWEVDPARGELRSRGTPIALGGRAFDIFAVLVQSAGELVTKDDLIARVWPDQIVEESRLHVHISAIRKALGPDREMVKTTAGRGYRLVGDWTIRGESTAGDKGPLVPAPNRPFRSNLPAARSELIGRTAAVQRVQHLLSAHRVVTLTGPGGIGKTALALEVARSLVPTFDGDVHIVDLVALSDPGLVPSAVSGALGLTLGGGDFSAEAVARVIGGRKLLLVLDNCEHVIDAAARLSEAVVRLCPHTSVLATSIELLRVEGEQVYRVPSLDAPPEHEHEPDVVLRYSAVQLLIARIAAQSEFSPRGEHFPAIIAICRRLDGIPLAIEFAAARAATLGVSEVAARLHDRFALLTEGRRTALPRHQTLRAALDWSYELLTEPEQHLLHRLAIFSGGFTLEAATAVMSDDGFATSTIVERISNLVSKSLLTLDRSAHPGRWRLLETTRAYALEKLGERGETERAARRHAEFFRDFFASMEPSSTMEATTEDLVRYRQDIDNVRAALDWSFSPVGDPSIGVVLTAVYSRAWTNLSLYFECRERAGQALECLGTGADLSGPLGLKLLLALAMALLNTLGPVERTNNVLVTALQIAESLDDRDAYLWNLWALWALQLNIGECRAAQSTAERFCRVAPRSGDPHSVLAGLRLIGTALQFGGDQREARRRLARALEPPFSAQDPLHPVWPQEHRAMTLAALARALWLQGLANQARDQARESLDMASIAHNKFTQFEVLRLAVCPVAFMTGDLAAAEQAVAMLADITANTNNVFWKVVAQCLESRLLIKRGEFERGVIILRAVLDTCDKTGWKSGYPEYLGVLAEGLAGLGRYAEAFATIDRALAAADHGGECWYVAELLRIKGEFLLQEAGDNSIPAAEGWFLEALKLAREQGALSWELRTAFSLACLKVRQGRQDDARQILAPVYHRFTEGFETADLRSARTMLEAL